MSLHGKHIILGGIAAIALALLLLPACSKDLPAEDSRYQYDGYFHSSGGNATVHFYTDIDAETLQITAGSEVSPPAVQKKDYPDSIWSTEIEGLAVVAYTPSTCDLYINVLPSDNSSRSFFVIGSKDGKKKTFLIEQN